ncbi:MAG: diguanylate cyclase [Proteobacteria bacterium]|nr:diguanylate cyclase [Pseudomonadota bacterium]
MSDDSRGTPAPPTSSDLAYRQVLDEVGAFVYTTDLQGHYTYANRLVLDLLRPGLRLDEVIGKAFTDFVKIDEDAELRQTDIRVLRDGETIYREEANLIHATGELRTYWSIKKPLRDADGAIVGMIGISHDITDKKRLEDAVRRHKDLLDTVLDSVDALVYMKDADGLFLYANQRVAQAFGRPAEAIIGCRDADLLPPEVAARFREVDRRILATRERSVSEEAVRDATGRECHYWSVVAPCAAPDGTPAVIGFSTDITELHELKEELQRQARTDSLTGIANRRTLFVEAQAAFSRSRRHGHTLSLIAIDLDHFKQINDRYGHPTGDEVLRDFAQACLDCLRKEDLLARTGGEEFCILLPETPLAHANATAERIREVAARICPGGRDTAPVTASIGVTCMEPADASFDQMFSRADKALYAAKAQGRDCVVAL